MKLLISIIISLFFLKLASQISLDYKLLKSLNSAELPAWDKTMKGVSFSVYPAMPISIFGIYSQGYFTKNDAMMRNGYKSAVAVGLALVTTTCLKYSISRSRPFIKYPNDIIQRANAGPYSFPSGHATAAFATATAISLSYKKWYVTVPSFVYASLVGYSRMRLGVHYPSDVLGGTVIGVGAGLLTWKLDKLINKK